MKGQATDMHYGASHLLFERAGELRKFSTHAEDIIWGYLKGKQLGIKFRRQHPLLFYVADFYCHDLKLIIEIDGSIHNKEDVRINDAERQIEIEALGISVLRFTNIEVLRTPENILHAIMKIIKEQQNISDQSSPLGAGEERSDQSSPLGAGGHAMIFSAGLGTRFKPWTDHHPKALAIVNGKSLLQRNIEYLQSYNIREVVVNVHHFSEQVIAAVKENNGWGSNVVISDETNEVLETGGGLLKAKDLLTGTIPFVTLNADFLTDLNLNDLFAFHQSKNALISFGITNRKTSRNFLFDEDNRLCGWENDSTGEQRIATDKPHLRPMAYSCVALFDSGIFDLIPQRGKFSLVDTYLSLAAAYPIYGYDHTGDKLVDVGKPESVAIAEQLFK